MFITWTTTCLHKLSSVIPRLHIPQQRYELTFKRSPNIAWKVPKMAKVSSLLIFVPISAWFLVIYLVYSPSEGNLIDDRFRERRSHLKSVCAKYSPEVFRTTQDVLLNKPKNESRFEGLSIYQLEHILVDHKHKVLYSYVPKVGSSNWKRVFLMLRGQSNVENPMEIPVPKVHDPSK